MDIKEYIKQAQRTTAELADRFTDEMHYTLGIVTEAGELADVYKKHIAYGRKMDYVNVSEEIGDLMWYVANLCRVLDIDFDKMLDTNIAKLRARYPEKFDEEHANNRNLEIERAILEK